MIGGGNLTTSMLYVGMSIFAVLSIFIFANNNNSKTKNIRIQGIVVVLALWIFMAIMAAFRAPSVGYDTYEYILRFENYNFGVKYNWGNAFQLKGVEPGYFFITVFIHSLTKDYHVYFLVIYLTIAGSFCYFTCSLYREFVEVFKKRSIFCFLPIVLVISHYIHSMNVMRNWLAISVSLFAFAFMAQKKFIKALIFIAISSMIHYTALSMLIIWIYLFIWRKSEIIINPKWVKIASLGMGALFFFVVPLMVDLLFKTKYSSYLGRPSNFISILPSLIVCIGGIVFAKEISKKGIYGRFCVACIPLQIAFLALGQIGASRVGYFFSFHSVYLMSLIYGCVEEKISDKRLRLFIRVLISLFVIVLFLRDLHSMEENSGLFPYVFGSN